MGFLTTLPRFSVPPAGVPSHSSGPSPHKLAHKLTSTRNRKEKISRPYFRDWTNLRHHDGKSFIAPPRLFRADKALYFPNLYGRTLHPDGIERDTTPQLYNRASVVTVFSSRWAEEQVETFVSEDANPALKELLTANPDAAQVVRVNLEDNSVKAWLVRMFMGGLRKRFGEENYGKYFLVRRGVTDLVRESIGLLNGKVGYTYLVDEECRIRWAASGASTPEEMEGFTKGMQKLVREAKEAPAEPPAPTPAPAAKTVKQGAKKGAAKA